MKCAYTYCTEGQNVDKAVAVEENGRYYHLGCFEKKEAKAKLFSMFCEYVKNDEKGNLIRGKIRDYIDKDGYNADFCVFALNYAINNQIKLHSIFGLKYLFNDSKIKQAYKTYINEHVTIQPHQEKVTHKVAHTQKKGWGSLVE